MCEILKYSSLNFWIFAASLTSVYSDIITAPENIAIESGNNVEMSCASNVTGSDTVVFWYGEGGTALCYCIGGQQPSLGCSGSTTSGCVLTIQNVSSDQAGWYQCSETAPSLANSAYAQLIVIADPPQCQTTPSGRVNVTDSVEMLCSVTYRPTGSLAPVMTWFNPQGAEIISCNRGDSGTNNCMTNVTAEEPEVPSHTCKTNFTSAPLPGSGSGSYATNIPSYSILNHTQPIVVQYPPNITINGIDGNNYTLGSTLICSAKAEPAELSYKWSDDNDTTVSNTGILSLDQLGQDLNYTCRACNQYWCNDDKITVNVIPVPVGTTTSLITTTTGTVTGGSSSEGLPPIQSSGVDAALIAGIVVGTLVLLAVAITIIICLRKDSCYLHRKLRSKKYEGDEDTNSSNSNTIQEAIGFVSPNAGGTLHFSSVKHQILSACIHCTQLTFGSSLRKRACNHCDTHVPYINDNNEIIDYDHNVKIVYSPLRQA